MEPHLEAALLECLDRLESDRPVDPAWVHRTFPGCEREIEEFLFTHPDIQDAKVIGVPDEKYGEEVCAWIQLRQGSDLDEGAIRAFCKDHIAYFKVPRYIRLVDDFPMTVTCKVQKFRMREIMVEELGL